MKRILLTALMITVCFFASGKKVVKSQWSNGIDDIRHYLFAYFTSNSTEGQQVCYAVSDNGLDFTPLNGGSPVLASDSISVSGGVRCSRRRDKYCCWRYND